MIFWSVTATMAPGKEEEAVQHLKKMAKFEQERHGIDVQIIQRMDGAAGRIMWLEKHESLAAWEAQDAHFRDDAEAMALMGEGAGLITDAEVHFWRTL